MRDLSKFWYTRHQGEQRGPFTTALVCANITRGRLCSYDQVSHDQQHWLSVMDVPEFYQALTSSVHSPLHTTDERSGFDRRFNADPGTSASHHNQRHASRRQPESASVIYHRQLRTRMLRGYQMRREKAFWPLLSLFLLILFVLLLAVLYPTPLPLPQSECEQPAAPEVNWDNCLLGAQSLDYADLSKAHLRNSYLSGSQMTGAILTDADLAFANLSRVQLSQANLRGANLQGANLRGADLSQADFRQANLSFADLRETDITGSEFEGVNLHRTLWPDGRECAPGSVGRCE